MKIAAANAIAFLARERVPDEVVAAMGVIGQNMEKIILFLLRLTQGLLVLFQ